jgi:hypothetical protein
MREVRRLSRRYDLAPLHCRYGISPIPKEKYVLFFEMRGETAKASPRKNQVTEN